MFNVTKQIQQQGDKHYSAVVNIVLLAFMGILNTEVMQHSYSKDHKLQLVNNTLTPKYNITSKHSITWPFTHKRGVWID